MSLLTQKTINKKFSISGVGVHTGLKVNMNVLPAPANTGIIFKRTDVKIHNTVIPNYRNVVDATLCTTISNEYNVKVSTIEHLMGALYGLGVDNVIVELDSQEVPIVDGSAKKFVELILGSSEIDFEIKYNNSVIKTQRNKVSLFEDDLNDIYNSRTFCLYEDIKKLESLGLGKGGSLNNAIVVKNDLILKIVFSNF